jgi:hypothetical protein
LLAGRPSCLNDREEVEEMRRQRAFCPAGESLSAVLPSRAFTTALLNKNLDSFLWYF